MNKQLLEGKEMVLGCQIEHGKMAYDLLTS